MFQVGQVGLTIELMKHQKEEFLSQKISTVLAAVSPVFFGRYPLTHGRRHTKCIGKAKNVITIKKVLRVSGGLRANRPSVGNGCVQRTGRDASERTGKYIS